MSQERTISRLEAELADAKALIEILELEKTVYTRRLKCLGKRHDLALRRLKREREKS